MGLQAGAAWGCLIAATLHSSSTTNTRSKTEQAYWGHSTSKSQFRGGFFLSTQRLSPLQAQLEAAHAPGRTLRTGFLSSTRLCLAHSGRPLSQLGLAKEMRISC